MLGSFNLSPFLEQELRMPRMCPRFSIAQGPVWGACPLCKSISIALAKLWHNTRGISMA